MRQRDVSPRRFNRIKIEERSLNIVAARDVALLFQWSIFRAKLRFIFSRLNLYPAFYFARYRASVRTLCQCYAILMNTAFHSFQVYFFFYACSNKRGIKDGESNFLHS